jgi:hypothetical protein
MMRSVAITENDKNALLDSGNGQTESLSLLDDNDWMCYELSSLGGNLGLWGAIRRHMDTV